jgi:hypothetical protein
MLSDDPDVKAEIMKGMVSDAVVFHASPDDKAANALFMDLGNYIKLVRRYEPPKVNNPQGEIGHAMICP